MTHKVLHETRVGGKVARPGAVVAPSQRELAAAPWCFELLEEQARQQGKPAEPPELFKQLMEQDRERAVQDGDNAVARRRRIALQLVQQALAALGHGREQLADHAKGVVEGMELGIEGDRREREEREEYERKRAADEAEWARLRDEDGAKRAAERGIVQPSQPGIGQVDVTQGAVEMLQALGRPVPQGPEQPEAAPQEQAERKPRRRPQE